MTRFIRKVQTFFLCRFLYSHSESEHTVLWKCVTTPNTTVMEKVEGHLGTKGVVLYLSQVNKGALVPYNVKTLFRFTVPIKYSL